MNPDRDPIIRYFFLNWDEPELYDKLLALGVTEGIAREAVKRSGSSIQIFVSQPEGDSRVIVSSTFKTSNLNWVKP